MIGAAYQQAVARAILGADHSPLIPDVLHLAFVDASGAQAPQPSVALPNTSAVWAVDGPTVQNSVVIDVGTTVAGWPTATRWVLLDDSGQVVVSGELEDPVTPTAGTPLTVPVGGLRVEVA